MLVETNYKPGLKMFIQTIGLKNDFKSSCFKKFKYLVHSPLLFNCLFVRDIFYVDFPNKLVLQQANINDRNFSYA